MPIRIRFHFYADPDPDPDPFSSFTIRKNQIFFTLIPSSASLHCFICLVSVTGVLIFNLLDVILKFS
jgi:hypothetical protein